MVRASTGRAFQTRRLETSDLPSTRRQGLTALAVDIFGCVFIAVMVCAALWTIPFPNTERETVQNVAAVMTPLRGREEAIHKSQLPPIALAFVGEHLTEHPERSIANRLCQGTALNHPPHIQVLDADPVVSAHQIGCHLVQVILSGVANVFLYPCNANALTVPHPASLDPTGETALCPRQSHLVLMRMPRGMDAPSVAQSSETIDPKINPNRLSSWFELGKFFLQDQRHKIASTGSLGNGNGRWAGLELSTPVHIQSSQSRNNQIRIAGIGTRKLESRYCIFSTLLVELPFEGWVSSFLVEKLHKGIVQMPQGLLNRNTGNLPQPSCLLFPLPLGQLSRTLVVTNTLLPHLPSICAIPQRPVVGIPTTPKNLSKLFLLGFSRRKPVLVSYLHTPILYA